MSATKRAAVRMEKYVEDYAALCDHFGVRGSKPFAANLRLLVAAAKRCEELEQRIRLARQKADELMDGVHTRGEVYRMFTETLGLRRPLPRARKAKVRR